MKTDLLKRVSKAQFAKACRENKTIRATCRELGIVPIQAQRLERMYKIDLPRNKHGLRTLDYDKIYDTYLKNDRHVATTAKIIGCHPNTVSRIVRKRKESDKNIGR